MAKKKKENRLVNMMICIVCAILLGVMIGVPTMLVAYTWILYSANIVALWQAVIATVLVCLGLSLVFVIEIGSRE